LVFRGNPEKDLGLGGSPGGGHLAGERKTRMSDSANTRQSKNLPRERIHSNRRRSPKDYAVWEIHPVMKMEVMQ
jgi:hypothetical protein